MSKEKTKEFEPDNKFDHQTNQIHEILKEIHEERASQGYKVSALLVVLIDNGERQFVHLHKEGPENPTHIIGIAIESLARGDKLLENCLAHEALMVAAQRLKISRETKEH